MRVSKAAKIQQRIREQIKWIEEHGGSRAGYILRYGSKHDPEHYGDGGEAIWDADRIELERLRAVCR